MMMLTVGVVIEAVFIYDCCNDHYDHDGELKLFVEKKQASVT